MTHFDSLDATPQIGAFTLTVTIQHDDDSDAPWDREDGHGPVSDWRKCDYAGNVPKSPGELMLCDNDRSGMSGHKSARFYDYAEACRIARRDGWGFLPGPLVTKQNSGGKWHAWVGREDGCGECLFNTGGHDDINAAINAVYDAHRATMTPRQYAASAARADYDRLRAWCNDDWSYVDVIVTATHTDTGIECGTASLWGIESDATDYLLETANELADEALTEARATIAALTE